MRAVWVPAAKSAKAWPHIAEWVSEALIRGKADISPEDVRQHLERGNMQLWLAWDDRPRGCCVTELILSPRGKVCNLVAVAGERWSTWAHLLDEIAKWAHDDWGCVRLALTGRKGWARRLGGDGWAETAVTLEKAIGDGRQQTD